MKVTTRPEDMSPRGCLNLIKQDDGDIIVEVVSEGHDGVLRSRDVEFCASGGRSPWTLQALYQLQKAMEKDNQGKPWPPVRKGFLTDDSCPRSNSGAKCEHGCRANAGTCWADSNDVDLP